MGHMTKSSRTFCTILKSHPNVLDQLRQCCFEEDSHVRKVEKTNQIFYKIQGCSEAENIRRGVDNFFENLCQISTKKKFRRLGSYPPRSEHP